MVGLHVLPNARAPVLDRSGRYGRLHIPPAYDRPVSESSGAGALGAPKVGFPFRPSLVGGVPGGLERRRNVQ